MDGRGAGVEPDLRGPSAESFTMARFASACPFPNSCVTTDGSCPAVVSRTYPAALGLLTCTFTATAVASAGTPPTPASGTTVGVVPTVPPNTRVASRGV